MLKTLSIVLAAFAFALAGPARAADKVNVLIIDGQHHSSHKWQETTPAIKEALLKTGRFNVEVLTAPGAKAPKEDWAKFKPEFSKYGTVLMNYFGTPWPEDVCQSFEKYMENGGGLVFYHASVFCFPKWDNFNKMMGLGWRDPKFGDRITLADDGKIIRTPKGEGPGGGHGPAHEFEMTVRQKDHPVMKGLPEKWKHAKDELYHGQRGPAENMQILASAFSSKEGKGSGANEPIIWTVSYGKGRTFVNLLGHDVPAISEPRAMALLCRGCEWTATGEVTQPAPEK